MPSHIPPDSGAPYIIICSTRIDIYAADDDTSKIQAASRGASMLVAFMQNHYKQFKPADCLPIATLQHELMDHVGGDISLTSAEIDGKVRELVREMYTLEKKYI